MQGTWKENIGGWHKDSRRKRHSRKHTLKDKFDALAGHYSRAERVNQSFDKETFRYENDDLIFVRSPESYEMPQIECTKVKFIARITLTEKKTSNREFKIVDSIEDLWPAPQPREQTTLYEKGKAISAIFGYASRYSSYVRREEKYFNTDGSSVESSLYKKYEQKFGKTHFVSIFVYTVQKFGSAPDFAEELIKKRKDNFKNSYGYTHKIYNWSDTRYIYGKPVYSHECHYRRHRSNGRRFAKKYTNSFLRGQELRFCKNVKMDLDIADEGFIKTFKECPEGSWLY